MAEWKSAHSSKAAKGKVKKEEEEDKEFGSNIEFDLSGGLLLSSYQPPAAPPAASMSPAKAPEANSKPKTEPPKAQPVGPAQPQQPLSYWEEVAMAPVYPNWLVDQASAFIASAKLDYFTPQELAATILNILKSNKKGNTTLATC